MILSVRTDVTKNIDIYNHDNNLVSLLGFNDSILGFNDSLLGFKYSILGFNDSILGFVLVLARKAARKPA